MRDPMKFVAGLGDLQRSLDEMGAGRASGMPRPPAEAREEEGIDRAWIAIPADEATEEWGVRIDGGRVVPMLRGESARPAADAFATAYLQSGNAGSAVVVRRFIGPWEPVTEEGQADG